MAVNAKPYKEGKGWVIRLRYKDNDIYISGQSSAAKAVAEAQKEVNHIDKHGQAAWGGAKGKTVAQALQRQAAQTLRFKKGAAQEARRSDDFNLPSTAVPCLGLAGENGSCEPLCFRAQHLLCNRDRDAHQLNPGLRGLALVVHVQDGVDALDSAWV
jgi:hypothetical protein